MVIIKSILILFDYLNFNNTYLLFLKDFFSLFFYYLHSKTNYKFKPYFHLDNLFLNIYEAEILIFFLFMKYFGWCKA